MYRLRLPVILFSCCLVLLFSCKKEVEDTSIPSFTYSLLDQNHQIILPDSNNFYQLDSSLNYSLEINYTDDIELKQSRIDVSDVFYTYADPLMSFFTITQIDDLSGTMFSNSYDLSFMDSLPAGPYQIALEAIDSRGNEAGQIVLNSLFSNSTSPLIQIDSLTTTVAAGDTLFIFGNISDNEALSSVYVKLFDQTQSLQLMSEKASVLNDTTFWIFDSLNINTPLIIDSSMIPSLYFLSVTAVDTSNNHSLYQKDILIE